ncbi:hypothetical protein Ocin01_17291 [Orchesella cincta]|uniref:Uncharacterized protein n=1 Tax=Orchesella cincta TaxID=48709 RepID=A0A1D2M8X4_ORCCI|nr:hypothetical protein Ocin01_17291 [Orchesella cincta]
MSWKLERKIQRKYKSSKDMANAGATGYYLDAIGKCRRDAYVETKDTLDRFNILLKTRLKTRDPKLPQQITMSKDTYGELCENWRFANIPWPATEFLIRAHGMLESGLIQVWKEWIYWASTYADELLSAKGEDENYRAVSLNGNIRALFFLYLSLSLVPILLFWGETSKYVVFREKTSVQQLTKWGNADAEDKIHRKEYSFVRTPKQVTTTQNQQGKEVIFYIIFGTLKFQPVTATMESSSDDFYIVEKVLKKAEGCQGEV